jgi:uncharacterized protein (TIGR00255 family)
MGPGRAAVRPPYFTGGFVMISSMTGFGQASATSGDTTISVEIKSVNSRFCEVSVRTPRVLSDRETDIQSLVKQSVARGRVSLHVQMNTADSRPELSVNAEAARSYGNALRALSADLGLGEEVRLEHVLRFPDVIGTAETADEDLESIWSVVQDVVREALSQFQAMRDEEGKALFADLISCLNDLSSCLRKVRLRAPERLSQARERIRDRIAELVSPDRLDPDRLEMEIAVLADKLDISEEIVRLDSHLTMFRESLDSEDSTVGRRLNFISQEINREINTIGSKANDADIAHLVVEMKDVLERMREQIENVQ